MAEKLINSKVLGQLIRVQIDAAALAAEERVPNTLLANLRKIIQKGLSG